MTLVAVDSFSSTVFCDDTISINFFVHDLPITSYTADTIQCEDVGFVINNFSTVSTGETLSYEWTIGGNPTSTTPNLSTVINNAGVYPINLTVTSSFGCETDSTIDMYVMATPAPPVLSFNTPECPGDDFFLTATGEANSTISWTGPNNYTSTLFNSTFPLDENEMGIYTAFLTSEYGCISDTTQIDATITYTMTFDDFDFPNVITPNSDQVNNELDLKSYFMTCDEFTLYIFNRWGNLVWEQSQDSPFFRGVDKGGKDLEEGVYIYKLVFENFEKQGFIHVLR
jgi:gliding motility-associated-like protein